MNDKDIITIKNQDACIEHRQQEYMRLERVLHQQIVEAGGTGNLRRNRKPVSEVELHYKDSKKVNSDDEEMLISIGEWSVRLVLDHHDEFLTAHIHHSSMSPIENKGTETPSFDMCELGKRDFKGGIKLELTTQELEEDLKKRYKD